MDGALYANTGGPLSRTRIEAVRSTLLGRVDGPVRCPLHRSLALDFEDADPRPAMELLLRAEGLTQPDELRALFETPGPRICRIDDAITPVRVRGASARNVLQIAYLLGLCSPTFLDPTRPVLWTRTTLTRRVHLFDPVGFYA